MATRIAAICPKGTHYFGRDQKRFAEELEKQGSLTEVFFVSNFQST